MQDGPKTAPGDLELVRQFVNTRHVAEGTDELSSARALSTWLAKQGLLSAGARASRSDLDRAVELRDALRESLLAHTEGIPTPDQACRVIDEACAHCRLVPHLEPSGRSLLLPEAGGAAGALGQLLGIVHRAMADGTWLRLKACRNEGCRWAFYDQTKNRSGAWCSMSACGNRAKARAFRQRHRGRVAPVAAQ